MKNVLLYIWQLPQTLLGYLVLFFCKVEKTLDYHGVRVRVCKFPGGISLGEVIIVSKYPTNQRLWNDVKHEYGHHLQSVRLGWFYLPLIGLLSLLGNIYDRVFHSGWSIEKSSKWYYSQPWEKGADILGGVER